jgi:hypothetical protein
MDVRKVDVWAAGIEDKPGGLAAKLRPLADAGASLEFVIARRDAAKPGTGVVFVAGLEGDDQAAAARDAGFARTDSLHSVRVAGADAPGLGAEISEALAEAGINLRGLSAAALGDEFVCYLALDTADDATSASELLENL